jgi:hypothetical protein
MLLPSRRDHVVQVRARPRETFGQRMHIDPQRQRPAVLVAKLRGDIRPPVGWPPALAQLERELHSEAGALRDG